MRQQVVDHFGPFRAFSGNLQITTSLDLDLQRAAESTISQMLPPGSGLPSASLVAIDNKTGEVRAMVGGADYTTTPVQPRDAGPAPARLDVQAVRADDRAAVRHLAGLGVELAAEAVPVPHSGGREYFVVRNYGDAYYGSQSLASATTTSDNSVYADVGIHVGTQQDRARGAAARHPHADLARTTR